jgi:excisionase family DNA binding protein
MVLIVVYEAIAVFVMKVFLSVAEIANVTKKEKTTVLRWIKAGRFGNIRKVGNEFRVSHKLALTGSFASNLPPRGSAASFPPSEYSYPSPAR